VESSATSLVVTGPVTVERTLDPTLPKGKRVVDEEGSRPTRTSATRTIYGADGTLIDTETWTTSYDVFALSSLSLTSIWSSTCEFPSKTYE